MTFNKSTTDFNKIAETTVFKDTNNSLSSLSSLSSYIKQANFAYVHSPCPDGDTLGFILKSINPNINLRGWDHASPPELNFKELVGQVVIFGDVVPPQLVQLCQVCKLVIVPDHHHPNLTSILKANFEVKTSALNANNVVLDSLIYPSEINTTESIQKHFSKQIPSNLVLLYSSADHSKTVCACKLVFQILSKEGWILNNNKEIHAKLEKFINVTNLSDTGKHSLMTQEDNELWLPWSGSLSTREILKAKSLDALGDVLQCQRSVKHEVKCNKLCELDQKYPITVCKYSMSTTNTTNTANTTNITSITSMNSANTMIYPFYEWLLNLSEQQIRKMGTAAILLRQQRTEYMFTMVVNGVVQTLSEKPKTVKACADEKGEQRDHKCCLVKLEDRDLEIMAGLSRMIFKEETSPPFALYYYHRYDVKTKKKITQVSVRQKPGTELLFNTLDISTSKGRKGGGHAQASALLCMVDILMLTVFVLYLVCKSFINCC